MVLLAGLTLTVLPVVEFIPVLGAQVYVFAPEALKVPLRPLHMLSDDVDVTLGVGLTVTMEVAFPEHPLLPTPVTV